MKKVDDSFQEFTRKLKAFDKRRGWIGLDPGDLAKSIVLEAAELLELFQWDNTHFKRKKTFLPKDKQAMAYEAADILIYLLKFCRETDIDLVSAAFEKLEKTEKKYPTDYKKRGGHKEYLRIKQEYRKKK